jgi:hypothetical protein
MDSRDQNGRTVVTTNGHIEFLDLEINETATPRQLTTATDVEVKWTQFQNNQAE